jgi:hypothetical protein
MPLMNTRTLSKIGVTSLSAVLAMVFLGQSVAERIGDTSKEDALITVTEAQKPASKRLTPIKSSAKKKAAAGTSFRPFLAATTVQKPVKQLLPAVRQIDITPRHQELADAVLRAIPAPCRTNLKNFFVKYTDVKQRGLGGKTTIILDGTPGDAEFVGLLVHECGHVTHSNMMGSVTAGASVFKDGTEIVYKDSPLVEFFSISWMTEGVMKAGQKKADFVSGYAQSDAFEDFGESFAMYILHRPAMRERAKTSPSIAAKLAWMEKHLPVSETAVGKDTYTSDKNVPWDVTKLPYELSM